MCFFSGKVLPLLVLPSCPLDYTLLSDYFHEYVEMTSTTTKTVATLVLAPALAALLPFWEGVFKEFPGATDLHR